MSQERKEFDIIVIGSGAGLTGIAIPAARNGLNVCLVERSALGGTCLNRGCIPSKMLIHPAQVALDIDESERYHINVARARCDQHSLVEEVVEYIDKAAEGWKPKILEKGIHIVQEEVAFVGKRVLKTAKSGQELTAPKIFIACGARPATAPIEGLEGTPYITYVEALRMTKKPKSMAVIGGGYIGAELAFFFHEMGVDVTVLDSKDNLADREDEELAEEFMKVFTSRIRVKSGVKITKVDYKDDMFTVEYGDDQKKREIQCEQLLVATGVKANCDQLQVEKSGIELTDKGEIKADECLRTTCEGVWALGDCVGNFMFRHTANFEADYLLTHAALPKDPIEKPINYSPVPHAIFSYPEVGSVGKTEQELREEGVPYIKGVAKYSDTPFGRALRTNQGFAKVLIHKESRQLLGFHIVGANACDIVHEVIPAMTMEGKLDDILKSIHVHPGLNEIVRDACRAARDELISQKVNIPIDIRYK